MAKDSITRRAMFASGIFKATEPGVCTTVVELKENQFGMTLPHYSQQYLFGATGLRLQVFHSISGVPAACKSPLLFDLMGHVCASSDVGGLDGVGVLYELEGKISPVLLSSMMKLHFKDLDECTVQVMKGMTLEGAFENLNKSVIKTYLEVSPDMSMPLIIGMDSIGGSSSGDVVSKLKTEGVASKGYYDKSHVMKHWCENASKVYENIPYVILCVNQEKEVASATYGPPQKKITGGTSQIYKDGHMISATFKTLASGDGKVITLRTTKTSFSDARKIEVNFMWNKYGKTLDDAYGHHFQWALASAKCLAAPEKGVGEIRDICDVKVSEKNLVTCPQLNCRSVDPVEFEQALFADENKEILQALRIYQKIDVIKDVSQYSTYMKERKQAVKPEKEAPKASTKPKTKPATKAKTVTTVKVPKVPVPAAPTPLFDTEEKEQENDG